VFSPLPMKNSTNDSHSDEGWKRYLSRYQASIKSNDEYWSETARKYITWFTPFHQVRTGSFEYGDIAWFTSGKLNACYNCIDRHLPLKGNQTAIIWEGDEIGESIKLTYNDLHHRICQIANIFLSKGVKKGDVVTIYMPMIPETAMTILACARIGAIHSVVFAGFSADSLRDRIIDCKSNFIVTTNQGRRGGKVLNLKSIVDSAVIQCPSVDTVFLFQYPNSELNRSQLNEERDYLMNENYSKFRPYCPCEPMDSEDILFILYTSGSTGKPKGVAHSTGGYLVNAAMTTEQTFNIQVSHEFLCSQSLFIFSLFVLFCFLAFLSLSVLSLVFISLTLISSLSQMIFTVV
jgi:acetyl-CoA synthetase